MGGIDLKLIPIPDEPHPEALQDLHVSLMQLPSHVPGAYRRGSSESNVSVGPVRASAGPAFFDLHAALSALPILGSALTDWVAGRSGRKVRVKLGNIEVEANTPEQVETLLEKARIFKAANQPKTAL